MPFDPNKYKDDFNRANYDDIKIRVPKGMREEIAKTAAERGLSLNKYIISLIEKDMKGSKE